MTMLIEIAPETEAELVRQAASQGVDVQAYAARLLEAAAQGSIGAKAKTTNPLDATLRDLAQFTHKIPLLSDEALSRESMYSDHD